MHRKLMKVAAYGNTVGQEGQDSKYFICKNVNLMKSYGWGNQDFSMYTLLYFLIFEPWVQYVAIYKLKRKNNDSCAHGALKAAPSLC